MNKIVTMAVGACVGAVISTSVVSAAAASSAYSVAIEFCDQTGALDGYSTLDSGVAAYAYRIQHHNGYRVVTFLRGSHQVHRVWWRCP